MFYLPHNCFSPPNCAAECNPSSRGGDAAWCELRAWFRGGCTVPTVGGEQVCAWGCMGTRVTMLLSSTQGLFSLLTQPGERVRGACVASGPFPQPPRVH